MEHRHLNHTNFTLSAIDDIISRGKMTDWIELRNYLHSNFKDAKEKILKICKAYQSDKYAQRYHFWRNYVEE
mgnify:CR=1 FL=1|jgi:AAA+ ATPase superfamily predicted ATPase